MTEETAKEPQKIQQQGKPVSGRTWKQQSSRSSAKISVSTLKSSFSSRIQKEYAQRQMILKERELKKEKEDEKIRRKEARKEKEKRRIENEKKGMTYQVISNAKKLKRLKKKQLRDVVKLS